MPTSRVGALTRWIALIGGLVLALAAAWAVLMGAPAEPVRHADAPPSASRPPGPDDIDDASKERLEEILEAEDAAPAVNRP